MKNKIVSTMIDEGVGWGVGERGDVVLVGVVTHQVIIQAIWPLPCCMSSYSEPNGVAHVLE